MEICYLELKSAQKFFNDNKEDELLLKCIKCDKFRQKENGYYCKDKPIRIIEWE